MQPQLHVTLPECDLSPFSRSQTFTNPLARIFHKDIFVCLYIFNIHCLNEAPDRSYTKPYYSIIMLNLGEVRTPIVSIHLHYTLFSIIQSLVPILHCFLCLSTFSIHSDWISMNLYLPPYKEGAVIQL